MQVRRQNVFPPHTSLQTQHISNFCLLLFLLSLPSPPSPSEFPASPGCAEGYARDATEIQNIQIADGDVCRGLSIPIYMVFPRLFTCPTLETTNFKVGKWIGLSPLLMSEAAFCDLHQLLLPAFCFQNIP